MITLVEDNRQQLINRAKSGADYKGDKSKGRNRYARRTHSKISSSVREYNNIDMNKFFKDDILDVAVKVHGETDDYLVRMSFSGVLDKIKDQISRNNGVFDFRIVVRALIDCFNRNDVYIFCTCLTGDTKINLLDGTCPTISEMKDRFDSGEQLYVYSVDEKGDFKPGVVEDVWITGEQSEFIEVTLGNDEIITTTPEHLYMLRTGEYVPAAELGVGTSLMSTYSNYRDVKSIRKVVLNTQPVYDIKVKDFNNFLVSAGVILHNCPDWHYRFGYFASVNNIIVGDKETRPSDITNPDDKLGPACKHVCLVLQNTIWLYKVAATIRNYINYMESHFQNAYEKIIYPKLYGQDYQEPEEETPEDEFTPEQQSPEFQDIANEYGATRGRFQKGNTQGVRFAKSTGEPILDDEEEED